MIEYLFESIIPIAQTLSLAELCLVLPMLIIGMLMFMTTLINVLTAPHLHRYRLHREHGDTHTLPLVSVMIPARDEALNIKGCLEGLLQQDYPNMEILVLDDHSTDSTAEIVTIVQHEYHTHPATITLLRGDLLPPDWKGKNWACHQLAAHAHGDILIFTDADNRHAPHAISSTITCMKRWKLDMFSAFPEQKTHTWMEQLIVPVIDMILYAGLPLWAMYVVPWSVFSAANGQWICFTRSTYDDIGGHEAVRGHVVEDVELSKAAKRKQKKILTLPGTHTVFCRMYTSSRDVWEGFTKNLFGLTGYSLSIFTLVTLLCFIACVAPYLVVMLHFLGFFISPALQILCYTAIMLNTIMRLLLHIRMRHPLINIITHPVGIFITLCIGINSVIGFKRGVVRWKGRNVATSKSVS
jgi:chlorobactene glucosyltransferase